MRAPAIKDSTEEDRRQYIKNIFKCIAEKVLFNLNLKNI